MNQNEKSDSTEQKLGLPAERAGAPLQLGVRRTFPPASVSGNYLSSEFPVLQPPPPTEMCVQDRSLGRGRVSCGLPVPVSPPSRGSAGARPASPSAVPGPAPLEAPGRLGSRAALEAAEITALWEPAGRASAGSADLQREGPVAFRAFRSTFLSRK